MSRLLPVIVLLILPFLSFGQRGNYFVSHFKPESDAFDTRIHAMVESDLGIMFLAQNSGIVAFDGSRWEEIKSPAAVFTFATKKEEIYTGGPGGFGQVSMDGTRQWKFELLHPVCDSARIFQMVATDTELFGIDEDELYIYRLETGQLTRMPAPRGAFYETIFALNHSIYATAVQQEDNRSVLLELVADRLEVISEGTLNDLEINQMIPSFTGNAAIAISAQNELYYYHNGFSPLLKNEKDNKRIDYLRQSIVTDVRWVSDTLVALSTLKGGVVFVNPLASRVRKILNARSGLPDNQVYALYSDHNAGVWVAHEKGLSRISPSLPIKTYDHIPGIEGKILSVFGHGSDLYLGTTTGAFHLKRIENYSYTAVKVTDPQKKGFFRKIWPFKKDNPSEDKQMSERELLSVEYTFARIKGIDSKVTSFKLFNNEVFAAGLNGLFKIRGEKSHQILDRPVRFFYYSPTRHSLFVSTYHGELFELDSHTGYSKRVLLHSSQTDPVGHIFEGQHGQVFFCSVNGVYVLSDNGRGIELTGTFSNPYYSDTYGLFQQDSLKIIFRTGDNSTGTFLLREDRDTLEALYQGRRLTQVLVGNSGELWLKNNDSWHVLGGQYNDQQVEELSFFKHIRYISRDDKGIWVVTEDNKLFYYDKSSPYTWSAERGPYLKRFQQSGGLVNLDGEVRIGQDNSSLNFDFIQPEYTGLLDIKYQYRLEGIQEEWSDWSADYSHLALPFLPPGEYTLFVRSSDVLGQTASLDPVSFKVLPPYWKRPWFYALEFAFIGLMLLISIKMKAMGYKYRLMSRLLALLTLITIIELIQVVLESKFETQTSPVIDFIIQVMMAIMILPVEELLRKYIFKEQHVKISEIFALRNQRSRSEQVKVQESVDSHL